MASFFAPTALPMVTLTGVSGTRYPFTLKPPPWPLPAEAGVYAALVYGDSLASVLVGPTVLYIGMSGSLDSRVGPSNIMRHHKLHQAIERGANYLGVLILPGASSALARDVESDLIAAYQPPLNGSPVKAA